LDEENNILNVQAGALWEDVIDYLDPRDLSVAVMQASNSFSVGGSLSVNCYGWPYRKPPIASAVESFRLLKADGTIVRCSREDNAELFSLVLGGTRLRVHDPGHPPLIAALGGNQGRVGLGSA
jgi:FAD/FMN-containing dehydrogenase